MTKFKTCTDRGINNILSELERQNEKMFLFCAHARTDSCTQFVLCSIRLCVLLLFSLRFLGNEKEMNKAICRLVWSYDSIPKKKPAANLLRYMKQWVRIACFRLSLNLCLVILRPPPHTHTHTPSSPPHPFRLQFICCVAVAIFLL